MIDISLHRHILLGILKDIFKDKYLAAQLGFKGGTCLYFFHNLSRFSIDLDFNLLGAGDFKPERIQAVLGQYIKIKDFSEKKNTWFWMGSYKETYRNIKVEVSKRSSPDEYEILDLYGLSVKCLKKPYLFAHKLCAISDRAVLANRDLFDAHFMFKNQFPIASEVIEARIGLSVADYFEKLVRHIPKHVSKQGILHGLGDVLDPKQKAWVKTHLLDELLFYLRSWITFPHQ